MQLCACQGWRCCVREAMVAGRKDAESRRASVEGERRSSVGGGLRGDGEEHRGATEASDPADHRRGAASGARQAFPSWGSRMTRTSLNARLPRGERNARHPHDQRGSLTARTSRAKRHARDASDSRRPLQGLNLRKTRDSQHSRERIHVGSTEAWRHRRRTRRIQWRRRGRHTRTAKNVSSL